MHKIFFILAFFCAQWGISQPFPALVQVPGNSTGESSVDFFLEVPNGYYLIGSYSDVLFYDSSLVISAPDKDVYILKTDKSGNLLWSQPFGNKGHVWLEYAVCDEQGNLYLSGLYEDSMEVASHELARNGFNPFVVKVDKTGSFAWNADISGNPSTYGRPRISAGSNKLLVTYGTSDSILAEGNKFYPRHNVSDELSVILKYSNNGQLLDTFFVDATNDFYNGSFEPVIYGSSHYLFNIKVDSGSLLHFGTQVLPQKAHNGLWLLKCDSSFAIVDSLFIKYSDALNFSKPYLAGNGNLYLSGGFVGTIQADGLLAQNLDTVNAGFLSDGFMAVVDANLSMTLLKRFGVQGNNEFVFGFAPNGNKLIAAGTATGELYYGNQVIDTLLHLETCLVHLDPSGNFVSLDHTLGLNIISQTSCKGLTKLGPDDFAVFGQINSNTVFLEDTMFRESFKAGYIWSLTLQRSELEETGLMPASLFLYPNPSKGKFTLELKESYDLKIEGLRVMDTYGRQVFSQEKPFDGNSKADILLSGLPSGVYFLTLKTDKGGVVKRLVIR